MAIWLREAAGWALLGVGLGAFAVCYFVFLTHKWIIEAFGFGFIGWTLFKGGLHLLKTSMAARIASTGSNSLRTESGIRGVKMPVGESKVGLGRERESVVPGPNSPKRPGALRDSRTMTR